MIIFLIILPLISSIILFIYGLIDNNVNCLKSTIIVCITLFINLTIIFLLSKLIPGNNELFYDVGNWPMFVGIQLKLDRLSLLMLLMINTISLYIFISGYELHNEKNFNYIIGSLWLLIIMGFNGVCLSTDLFNIFVFLEVASVAIYILVGTSAPQIAYNYLIIGSIGTNLFVLGIGLIYLVTGSLNIDDVSQKLVLLESNPHSYKIIYLAMLCIFSGLSIKSGITPFGSWLLDVYQHSSNTFTAFLSGTATKVTLYLIIKMLILFKSYILINNFILFLPVFLSIITIIVSYYTIWEDDLKRILALSSLSHILYITIAILLMSDSGINAAIIHIFNHSMIKVAFFMMIGIWIHVFNCSSLVKLSGTGKLMPYSSLLILVLGLSLIGMPGTVGFTSKWYLLVASWDHKFMILLVPMILLSSLLSVIYIAKILETLWFDSEFQTNINLKISNFPSITFIITIIFVLINILNVQII